LINLLTYNECKIDDRGRLRIPIDLIGKLPESDKSKFVLNRGLDGYISMFPLSSWESTSAKVNKLNQYKEKNRKFKRFFFKGAEMVEVDSSGRILLPKQLIAFSEIEKEVVLVAYGENIEIWAKEKYNAAYDKEPENFSDMAESVLGGDIDDLD
jgi:MraZ protein